MLCQFTVKNFRCIKDELTLDMQATDINEHTESIITDVDGESFLPLATLYGPNGAGKSTVIEALSVLIEKIKRPIDVAEGNRPDSFPLNKENIIKPFIFSEHTPNLFTEFEIFFRTKRYEYQYQIKIDKNVVLYESLSRKKILGQRYSLIFSRDKNKNPSISFKGSLSGYKAIGLSAQLPLLSYLAITYKENAIINDAITWFDEQILTFNFKIDLPIALIAHLTMLYTKDIKIKQIILDILKEMNIDIKDYRIEKESKTSHIFTKHIVENRDYELPLENESDGTIKLFALLPYIILSLSYGATLLIDELDSRLHPKLLQYIISLYNDKQKNPKGAQLIFTSHDLATMNSENFRRDEIWFVAKGEDEGSIMYSLVEIKKSEDTSIEEDEKYSKSYLMGRYGADPYLKRIIQWEDFYGEKTR